jgi:hypothetical protein
MSEFIAVVRAKKLENLPQPDVRGLEDTGANPNLRLVHINLAEQVMQFTPRLSDETDVHARVCVAERVHAYESSVLRL